MGTTGEVAADATSAPPSRRTPRISAPGGSACSAAAQADGDPQGCWAPGRGTAVERYPHRRRALSRERWTRRLRALSSGTGCSVSSEGKSDGAPVFKYASSADPSVTNRGDQGVGAFSTGLWKVFVHPEAAGSILTHVRKHGRRQQVATGIQQSALDLPLPSRVVARRLDRGDTSATATIRSGDLTARWINMSPGPMSCGRCLAGNF